MQNSKSTSVSLAASGRVRLSQYNNWQAYDTKLVSTFQQASQNHRGPPYRTGGPWFMERTRVTGTMSAQNTPLLEGTICLGNPSTSVVADLPFANIDEDTCKVLGQKLWIAGAPTHPSVDFFTSIGELRSEGLPRVPWYRQLRGAADMSYLTRVHEETAQWRDVTSAMKKDMSSSQQADEYLNLEFGWKPVLGDMRAFAATVKDFHKKVNRYKQSANMFVKRSLSLPPTTSTQNVNCRHIVIPTAANVFAEGGGYYVQRIQKSWFEGTYRFRMPLGNDLLSRMSRYEKLANKLFGVRPDPSAVWNLSPWSWAVDWFVDVGSVLDAIDTTAQDGLTSMNTYFMTSNYHAMYQNGTVNSKLISAFLTRLNEYETKRRVQASPFGFDVLFDGLTAKQLGIIAALGISRGM